MLLRAFGALRLGRVAVPAPGLCVAAVLIRNPACTAALPVCTAVGMPGLTPEPHKLVIPTYTTR